VIDYLPFLVFLMILAVFLGAESALTIIYMVIGIFLLSLWWNKRGLRHIEIFRKFDQYAFWGEKINVSLQIHNQSLLPILWLELHESIPVNLRAGRRVKNVFSLGSRHGETIAYQLNASKRGYYALGPLLIRSGDPLGLLEPSQRTFPENFLTVYPQIVKLEFLDVLSQSPFGTIKHKNPIFEDPSRLLGKRDYQVGDPPQKIDWKSTASAGHLLVKQYEASIALEVVILLNLNQEDYPIKNRFDATEIAITAAASIAAWGKVHAHALGLITNGVDPLYENAIPQPIMPHKGSNHFINILEVLARIQPGETFSLATLIQNSMVELSWGASVILISGTMDKEYLEHLYHARKKGINPIIVLTSPSRNLHKLREYSSCYKIPLYSAYNLTQLRHLGM